MSAPVTGASRKRRSQFKRSPPSSTISTVALPGIFHCADPVIQGVAPNRKNASTAGHPARLDSSSNSIQRNDMNRTRLRFVFVLALVGAAVGFGTRTPAPLARATAHAAGPAVTPKTEAPNEARALSHAFSNVAKALGPSVVRIEVEIARGGPQDRKSTRLN